MSQEFPLIVGVRDHGVGIFSMSLFDGDMDGIQGKNTERFLIFFQVPKNHHYLSVGTRPWYLILAKP